MRRTLSWAALLILAVPAAAIGAAPSTRVSVRPGSGTPHTHFTLRLRIPVATGTFASVLRRDTVTVSGPRHAGCVSSAGRILRPARKGARIRLTLSPGRGSWCAGQWRGAVMQIEVVRCTPGPARACPLLVIAPRTIARFRFRVRPASSPPPPPPPPPPSGDVPTFAGLVSATTCPSPTPQAHLLPHPTSYTLTWKAATDPVTSSSGIVYDIFVATSPGGEAYAKATWTTLPGATSFVTPSVPRNGPAYFVVRARNAAGHEDANTVERQGVVQCPPSPAQ